MTLNFISYGGGIQSTTIILMSIDGLLPKPDCIVFADTGSELPSTYQTIQNIKQLSSDNNIPFHTVYSNIQGFPKGIPLHEYYYQTKKPPYLPLVNNPRCTFHFKIYPIRRFIKTLVNKSISKPWAISSLGITTDEKHRAKSSDVQWIKNSFPLLDMNYSRDDCINYINTNYPNLSVSKSGCFLCMYQSSDEWVKLKINNPDLFEIALELERSSKSKGQKSGLFAGKSIDRFNYSHTLDDFGFNFTPEIFECSSSSGGCFL